MSEYDFITNKKLNRIMRMFQYITGCSECKAKTMIEETDILHEYTEDLKSEKDYIHVVKWIFRKLLETNNLSNMAAYQHLYDLIERSYKIAKEQEQNREFFEIPSQSNLSIKKNTELVTWTPVLTKEKYRDLFNMVSPFAHKDSPEDTDDKSNEYNHYISDSHSVLSLSEEEKKYFRKNVYTLLRNTFIQYWKSLPNEKKAYSDAKIYDIMDFKCFLQERLRNSINRNEFPLIFLIKSFTFIYPLINIWYEDGFDTHSFDFRIPEIILLLRKEGELSDITDEIL